MKLNSLQIGKAMSAALFVLLLSVAGMKNALAQTQVATLQHGDDISVFYGQNSFVDAHTAAETGDIITLSSGTFTPCDITKAISLRGAGCVIDTTTDVYPTIIPNNLLMNVTNENDFLSIEGVFFSGEVRCRSLYQPKFIKCNFESFHDYGSPGMEDAQITNCKFNHFDFSNNTQNTTLINCVVWSAYYMNNVACSVTAYNSFIKIENNSASALNAYNCIVVRGGEGYYTYGMAGNSVAYNCIGIKNGSSVFGLCQSFNCMDNKTYSQVFDTFNPGDNYSFSFDEPLILKEEIATGFLGTDGTEVGIHGGTMPYSSRPSYMILKRCNVANRSTIDGKLSVDIEVITEDE